MLAFLEETGANFVSLPDAFTPYFAGKVYRRALLDDVGRRHRRPAGRPRHPFRPLCRLSSKPIATGLARWSMKSCRSMTATFLLKVREAAQGNLRRRPHACGCGRRQHRSPIPCSKAMNSPAASSAASDHVLDIACGDGYGCRILAERVGKVLGVDINQPLIAANQQKNETTNIAYGVDDCFRPVAARWRRHRRHRHGADRASAGGPGGPVRAAKCAGWWRRAAASSAPRPRTAMATFPSCPGM